MEVVHVEGLLESPSNLLEKYRLLFMIDGEKYDDVLVTYYDEHFRRWIIPHSQNVRLKDFTFGFCHASYPGSKGCKNVKTGEFNLSVVLENVESGVKHKLGEKHVKMGEFMHTILHAQVFIGSERSLYEKRPENDFDWNSAVAVYSADIQDTIFYYLKKYMCDTIVAYDTKYYIEVP